MLKEKAQEKLVKTRKIVSTSLLDLAKGCVLKEKTEEFVVNAEGVLVLKSRKVVKKQLTPDLSAIKVLMDFNEKDEFENMTDEELEKEKKRLMEELETLKKGEKNEKKE